MRASISKKSGILLETLVGLAFFVGGWVADKLFGFLTDPFFSSIDSAIVVAMVAIFIVALTSVIINSMVIQRQSQSLSEINQRLGVSFRFVPNPIKHNKGEAHKAARQYIEKAEREILALQHVRSTRYADAFEPAKLREGDTYLKERDTYFSTIEKKIMEHKEDRFFYRRILQTEIPTETPLQERHLSRIWGNHIKRVLEIMQDYPDAAYIKRCTVHHELSFTVIDERYIIWGLPSTILEAKQYFTEGVLLFDDINGDFARYLKRLFMRVDAKSTVVDFLTVEESE